MLPRRLTHLRLGHLAQRKASTAELLLREPKEEICLIFGWIGGPPEQPAIALRIKFTAGIVSRRQEIGPNLAGSDQQLIELEMIVAEAAGNRRTSGKILLDKRTHYVILKPLLVIHDVIRNAQVFSHATGVVDIVNRTAASLDMLGHAGMSGQ